MYKESVEKIRPELEKVVDYYKRELQKIRSGKASPSLVEDLTVDCFGSKLPLKQLATISSPEPRRLIIQPWTHEYLEGIEKALQRADLGTSPVVDGGLIRINLPPLTGEFREKLISHVSQKAEESYQTIRRWRDEAWKEIQEKERKGEVSEDDKYRGKDELQKMIDEYNKQIEKIKEKKEREIKE
jgi:ribosome recycling factor